jgi:REP element-mobilizing transposase RayT
MSYDQLRKGRVSETGRAYVVTTVLARRDRRYFADFACARLVVAEMRRLHDSGDANSLAWVVMPDPVHWLFLLTESAGLSEVAKRLKARSARRINAHLSREGALWQKAFYDRAVREEEDLWDIARYIVANPIRAGLAERIGDYPLWDAAWL